MCFTQFRSGILRNIANESMRLTISFIPGMTGSLRCVFSVGLALSLLTTAPYASQPMSAERQDELQNMLVQDCGSCHGLTFRGGLGPPLLPEALQQKPRDFLIATILNGRPGTAMPPWHPLMTQAEAEWMLDRLLANNKP